MENTHNSWNAEKRSITLTKSEWNRLEIFLIMSRNYRKEEFKAWLEVSQRVDENGNPTFKNAKANAEFWKEQDQTMEKIISVLRGF